CVGNGELRAQGATGARRGGRSDRRRAIDAGLRRHGELRSTDGRARARGTGPRETPVRPTAPRGRWLSLDERSNAPLLSENVVAEVDPLRSGNSEGHARARRFRPRIAVSLVVRL